MTSAAILCERATASRSETLDCGCWGCCLRIEEELVGRDPGSEQPAAYGAGVALKGPPPEREGWSCRSCCCCEWDRLSATAGAPPTASRGADGSIRAEGMRRISNLGSAGRLPAGRGEEEEQQQQWAAPEPS
jgi:hypothetical protein